MSPLAKMPMLLLLLLLLQLGKRALAHVCERQSVCNYSHRPTDSVQHACEHARCSTGDRSELRDDACSKATTTVNQ